MVDRLPEGMPGVDSHWAFIIVCVILVLVAVGQVMFFRREGWMQVAPSTRQ